MDQLNCCLFYGSYCILMRKIFNYLLGMRPEIVFLKLRIRNKFLVVMKCIFHARLFSELSKKLFSQIIIADDCVPPSLSLVFYSEFVFLELFSDLSFSHHLWEQYFRRFCNSKGGDDTFKHIQSSTNWI